MPSLRSCSVGPPPSAIHGRGRLPRHPCRGAHCAEPALGLSRGRAPPKPKRGGLRAGLVPQRLRVLMTPDHSHAPCGNASPDAPRHPCARLKPGGDSWDAERPRRHSHAEHGNDQQQKHREQAHSHLKQIGAQRFMIVLIVPTLCVGMHPVTLRVTLAQGSSLVWIAGTQSVPGGIPTRSVGTINHR
jgi:hypothetical protein